MSGLVEGEMSMLLESLHNGSLGKWRNSKMDFTLENSLYRREGKQIYAHFYIRLVVTSVIMQPPKLERILESSNLNKFNSFGR